MDRYLLLHGNAGNLASNGSSRALTNGALLAAGAL
jgi:hypothetical protein